MPTPKSADPLVPLPCRVPASTAKLLRAKATEAGVSVSDVLRSHLSLDEVKPLGKTRPRRRREKALAEVNSTDPKLLQALCLIGINVRHITVFLNSVQLEPGKHAVDASGLLVELRAIQEALARLTDQADPEPVPLPATRKVA